MEDFDVDCDLHSLLDIACAPAEYGRVRNPKTPEDYLLRMQAEAITDHARIYRVMLDRARSTGSNTLLLDHHRSDFDEYLSYLEEHNSMICDRVASRYILTNNYDAMCLRCDQGKVVIISEVLRYFLYYMNLGTLQLPDVPEDVRNSSILIAVRTLLLKEALDFDLDPRGIVPPDIHAEVAAMVGWQMKFIIGHEFAHHILGHSSDDNLFMAKKFRFADDDVGDWVGYRRSHAEEFQADIHSISAATNPQTRYSLFVGGTMFLLALSAFEAVAEELQPGFADIDTHPETIVRFRRLINTFRDDPAFKVEGVDRVIAYYEHIISSLKDHLVHHPEMFERYGSVYLASWQGPVLRDRINY